MSFLTIRGRKLMDHVRLATLAVSLGGVETLIEHPASMTHAGISTEDRRIAGFSDGLVRYSVGIEDAEDLIADLRQALDWVSTTRSAPTRALYNAEKDEKNGAVNQILAGRTTA